MSCEILIPGGLYIVGEGPGKSGKSSTLFNIAEKLSRRRFVVVTTREPGGPQEAEDLRKEIFLLKSRNELSPLAEMEMFYKARALSMIWVVSQMKEGKIVIKDRDYVSTEVMQIISGVSQKELESMHSKLYREKNFPNPDLRMIILPSYEVIKSRRRGSMGDAFDELEEQIIRNFYNGYGAIAYDISSIGRRCHSLLSGDTVVINAIGDVNSVASMAILHVMDTIHRIRIKYPNGRDF